MSDFHTAVASAYQRISKTDEEETWWHKHSNLTRFRQLLQRRGCLICLLNASDDISTLYSGTSKKASSAAKAKLKLILEQSDGYLQARRLLDNLAVCKAHAVNTEVLLGQGRDWSLIVAVRMHPFLWPMLGRVTCLTEGAPANGKWIVFGCCQAAPKRGTKLARSILSYEGRMIVNDAVSHIRKEMRGHILRRLNVPKSDYVSFAVNFLASYPNHITGSRVDTAVNLVRPILYGLGVETPSGSVDDDHSRVWDWIQRSFPARIPIALRKAFKPRSKKQSTRKLTASAARLRDENEDPPPPVVKPPKRSGPKLTDPAAAPDKPKYTQLAVLQASAALTGGFGHLCLALHPTSEEWTILSQKVDARFGAGMGGWLAIDFAAKPTEGLDALLNMGTYPAELRLAKCEDFALPLIREGSVSSAKYNVKYLVVENAKFDAFVNKIVEYQESPNRYSLYVNNCTHAASELVNTLAPSVISLRDVPVMPENWFNGWLPGKAYQIKDENGEILRSKETFFPELLKADPPPVTVSPQKRQPPPPQSPSPDHPTPIPAPDPNSSGDDNGNGGEPKPEQPPTTGGGYPNQLPPPTTPKQPPAEPSAPTEPPTQPPNPPEEPNQTPGDQPDGKDDPQKADKQDGKRGKKK